MKKTCRVIHETAETESSLENTPMSDCSLSGKNCLFCSQNQKILSFDKMEGVHERHTEIVR